MSRQNNVEIIVYRITGRQGVIDVPHHYCEECDLTVSVVDRVVDEIDDPAVTLTVKPWMLHFWRPLIHGGWHTPIVTINGKIYSQGVVPSFDELLDSVHQELAGSECRSEVAQRVS